jgi:hypothetical protein
LGGENRSPVLLDGDGRLDAGTAKGWKTFAGAPNGFLDNVATLSIGVLASDSPFDGKELIVYV